MTYFNRLSQLCLILITIGSCGYASSVSGFAVSDISVKPNGRVLTDVAWYSNDGELILGDGTQLRSLRLGAKGDLCPVCGYSVSVDFARSRSSIRDAYMYYDLLENFRLTVGHYKPPMSLEFIDSSLSISFLERALPNIFVTSRRAGVGFDYYTKIKPDLSVTYSLGGFTEPLDTPSVVEKNQGYNISTRLNVLHQFSDRCYGLSGIGFSYTRTDTDNEIRYAPRPESSVTNTRLIDTGRIEQSHAASLWNYEFAWQQGPFSIQGEYFWNHLMRDNLQSLDFDGYYIYGSYFLTDDYRPINHRFSKHGRIKPTGCWGAVEALFRYSNLNLNDKDILGGRESNFTVGINWYLNEYIRFMVNMIDVKARQSDQVVKANIYTVRAQFDFS